MHNAQTFKPSEDSTNRLERFAFFALAAEDFEAAEEAEAEFYASGSEDDCYHEDAG